MVDLIAELSGSEVVGVHFGEVLELAFSTGTLRIATAFLLSDGGRTSNPDVRDPASTAESLVRLLHARVLSARADQHGKLVVAFTGSRTIYVSAHPTVAAWRIERDGAAIVSTPGGYLVADALPPEVAG